MEIVSLVNRMSLIGMVRMLFGLGNNFSVQDSVSNLVVAIGRSPLKM